MNILKRTISFLLVLVLLAGLVPAGAVRAVETPAPSAEGSSNTAQPEEQPRYQDRG